MATYVHAPDNNYLPLTAWDFGRCITLCRLAYTAGYLNREETISKASQVARFLQMSFDSWEEYEEDFLKGAEFHEAAARTGKLAELQQNVSLMDEICAHIGWGESVGNGPVAMDGYNNEAKQAVSEFHSGLTNEYKQRALDTYQRALAVQARCDALLQRDPAAASAHVQRAIMRQHLGDLHGALVDFNEVIRLEQDKPNPNSYYLRGVCRLEYKDFAGAVADLDWALAHEPGLVAIGTSDYNRALFQLGRELDRAALGPEPKQYVASLGQDDPLPVTQPSKEASAKARRFYFDGRTRRNDTSRIRNLHPRDPRLIAKCARLAEEAGEPARAVQEISLALAIDPSVNEWYLLRARCQFQDQRYGETIADLDWAMLHDDNLNQKDGMHPLSPEGMEVARLMDRTLIQVAKYQKLNNRWP